MNIALVTTFYGENLGGAEKSIGLLISILREKGINVKVFSTRAYKLPQEDVVQIPYTKYLPNKLLLLGNGFLDWYLAWCLGRVIKKGDDYDLIHTQDFFMLPASVKLAKKRKIKIVGHVREAMSKKIYKGNYLPPVIWLGNFLLRLRFKVWKKSLKQCSHIIGVSNFIKKDLVRNGITSRKISVIYNFSSPEMIRERKKNNRLEETLSGKIIFFMPGRIEVEKGYRLLINTLRKFSSRNYQVRIAGRGPYQSKLESLVKKYGLSDEVKFLGQLEDDAMEKEYYNCDFLLQLGEVPEAFGRTILEALLYRKKIIAVDVGAKKELIVNQQRGFLIAKDSQVELLQILELVTSKGKKYARITEEEFQQILEDFSVERTYKKFLKVYKLYGSREV